MTAVFGALFSSCSVFAALRLMHGECRRYFIIEEHAELLRHGAKKYPNTCGDGKIGYNTVYE